MDEKELFDAVEDELTRCINDVWQKWLGYLFRNGEMGSDGRFILNKETSERWWRQRNSSFENFHDDEKASHKAIVDEIIFHVKHGVLKKELETKLAEAERRM